MHDAFLDRLAQPRPDPGGGAAAAHGGLLGLAIMEKVSLLESARPQGVERAAMWQDILGLIHSLRSEFQVLRERDSAAYLKLAQAKAAGISSHCLREASEEALMCPVSIMETSLRSLTTLADIGRHCGTHLIADIQVALEFVSASFHGAYYIATANVRVMSRYGIEHPFSGRLADLWSQGQEQIRAVSDRVRMRVGWIHPHTKTEEH